MIKCGVIAVILVAMVQLSWASDCQTCMSNNAYCATENEYYICMGGKKHGPNYCDPDEVCTNSLDSICVKKTDIQGDVQNVCGEGNGNCQACAAGQKFTCASRTQAALCANNEFNPNVIINCDEDEICVAKAEDAFGNVCVPSCVASYAEWNSTCTNDVFTPPTLAPPTTPGPTEMQNICLAAAEGKTSRYFFAYADSTCRSYVYCEKNALSSPTFETTFTGSCSSPKIYFNTASGSCQSSMPANCLTDAPTTTAPPSPTTQSTPTAAPTTSPTDAPSSPTDAPTTSPTAAPTTSPTDAPSSPTDAPTTSPTAAPTTSPTAAPTPSPTDAPSSG